MKINNEIPRRSRLDLNTPAELAVTNAVQEVERMGANIKLTEAVQLLAKAKEAISDYVDMEISKRDNPSPDSAQPKQSGFIINGEKVDTWDEVSKKWNEFQIAQPKQEVKYPEGILAFRQGTDAIYTYCRNEEYQEWCESLKSFEIWQVRNAAGEVLTVGDVPESLNSNKTHFKYGRISGFEIREIMSGVLAIVALSDSNIAINVNRLTKTPVKQPLFASEEDLAVFDGDEFYRVERGIVYKYTASAKNDYSINDYPRFKIKANADRYVAENRKSVSWRELKEYCEKAQVNMKDFGFEKIMNTITSEGLLNHFSPHQKPAPGEDGETS